MPRVTPIRTPVRASDHLTRVHSYGVEASLVTAWFGADAAAKNLSRLADGTQFKTFITHIWQAGQRALAHPPASDGVTANAPSAALPTTRREAL